MSERKDVTIPMTANELQFLIWVTRTLQGGVDIPDHKKLQRWEAVLTRAIGKYFDKLPAHAMPELDEEE
jgi:hypothetical protein